MAVKASATVTITCYRDTESVTRYYKLQSSTATAPSKPTSNPPSGWTDTEPSYTSGSTNTLYFTDCSVFSNGTFSYSAVSKSSSYEAAKEAYNKAIAAQNAANDAAKTATNYVDMTNEKGVIIGNMTADVLGNNVLIDTDSVDIRAGDTVLASYGKNTIYLGKNNTNSTIDLCNGSAKMSFVEYSGEKAFTLSAADRIGVASDSVYLLSNTSPLIPASIHIDTEEIAGPYGPNYKGNISIATRHFTNGTGAAGTKSEINLNGSHVELYSSGLTNSSPTGIVIDTSEVSVIGNIVFENNSNIYARNAADTADYSMLYMNSSNATILGYGAYSASVGGTYVYGNNLYLFSKSSIYVTGTFKCNVTMGNNYHLYGLNTSGTNRSLLYMNSSNKTILGYGGYSGSEGSTDIYGNNINFYVKSASANYKPYYSKGDTLTVYLYLGGFVSNSSKQVYFSVPLAKPIVGSPTVTVTSDNGLVIRQQGKYLFGSAASTWSKPSSYAVTNDAGNTIRVIATMANTTNAVNNESCGITASLTIKFS